MGNKTSLMDTAFEMKLKSKELQRMSKKCEKEEKQERAKVKAAIEKGNRDGAQVFAQNAIRKKSEALNYLRMSAKFDAVASKLESADMTKDLHKSIAKTVPQLEKAMKKMDIEDISKDMEKFEKMLEDLDVRADYITQAVDATNAASTPADQVDDLLKQVGEEHQLDVSNMLTAVGPATSQLPQQQQQAAAAPAAGEDPLMARLNAL
mmetsp:Transcript_129771/g.295917  ORF Transcript_129771/g.295917 Transcript_129771/m.295917 type:complete len:207 (+) Transcript_129771:3-623(+)